MAENTYSRRGVVCPHCEHLHKDSWEMFPNGEADIETECEACEKPMFVSLHISHSYTATAVEASE
jgi:hypothetical protein